MSRHLFAFLSAVSLVLFVQALILSTVGHGATMVFPFQSGGARWQVVSEAGTVRVDNRPQVEADRLTRDALRQAHDRQTAQERERLRTRLNKLRREVARNPRLTVDQDRVYAEQLAEMTRASGELAAYAAGPPNPGPTTTDVTALVVRHEQLAAGLGVLPAWWLIGTVAGLVRRRRRQAARCCLACGYDLRGSPQEGSALLERCPECGAVPAA